MKIGFFTEGGYKGGIARDNPNMRTDLAWIHAMNATHHPWPELAEIPNDTYDIGIIIIPKTTGGNTGASKNPYDRDNLTKQIIP